ncbi:F0F1 ATP synthase subunit delta [Chitinasiproducens palmae]|uniref:ATP synthase subunit delta n=1 Tax=Chitinasiproducens palmae TaxID=1770053 RepID=A0A1H2PP55_9BURK|nr:F0F1 ATP synthase subunit delta [Chitinasiproducens palmae]SDV48524.1 ATP synthase F1 subcomplex delta subunit [Chitinasiproducens palmae]
MAELATVARPYAEAAFSVAEKGDLNVWSDGLRQLAELVRLPEVAEASSNPRISRRQIADLLLTAVKPAPGAELKNFVEMLVDNHRLALLPEISVQFDALKNSSEGVADAEIRSAFPLEGAALTSLVAALERKFARKLRPTVVVDPSLIGGVSVKVGDELLDTSVRARLAQMESALTA